jgi:hypothetical protein
MPFVALKRECTGRAKPPQRKLKRSQEPVRKGFAIKKTFFLPLNKEVRGSPKWWGLWRRVWRGKRHPCVRKRLVLRKRNGSHHVSEYTPAW